MCFGQPSPLSPYFTHYLPCSIGRTALQCAIDYNQPDVFAYLLSVSISAVLAAASALVVFGRCRVPAQVVQRLSIFSPELVTMLSHRWRAHASLQDKVCLGNERLQLLCCGCPLSALLLRLATVVGHSGCPSIEHMYVVCIMKRYFSGVARRLWSKLHAVTALHPNRFF